MRPFKNLYINFKGRSSKDFNLMVVDIGKEDTSTLDVGVSRSVSFMDNTISSPVSDISYKPKTIEFNLCKISDKNELMPITIEDEFQINQWLYGDDGFHPLFSEDNRDLIFYVMCIGTKKYLNGSREGYFTVTMQMDSTHCYAPIRHNNFYVKGEKTVEIMCKQNVGQYHYPDVEFYLLNDTTDIKITNLTLNETMEFKNIPKNSHVYCYNEGLKQIQCMDDKSLNLRPNFNKSWLRLRYGKNIIKIEGTCDIDIITQYKITMQ